MAPRSPQAVELGVSGELNGWLSDELAVGSLQPGQVAFVDSQHAVLVTESGGYRHERIQDHRLASDPDSGVELHRWGTATEICAEVVIKAGEEVPDLSNRDLGVEYLGKLEPDEAAAIADWLERQPMAEVLFETQSPARYADSFRWVHSGHMTGVDYIDAVSGRWLGVEFYETDSGTEAIAANVRQDRLAFEERTGHEVAHVTIDREEARLRTERARLASQEVA